MRSSLRAVTVGLGLALAAAMGPTGCAGCTPVGCGRNSDCPTGQVCNASAQCSLAPDGASDGAAQTDDALPGDAATDDAATDDASARIIPDPPERSVYPRRQGERHLRLHP